MVKGGIDSFLVVSSDQMWGDGLKLCQQESRLGIGENILTENVF